MFGSISGCYSVPMIYVSIIVPPDYYHVDCRSFLGRFENEIPRVFQFSFFKIVLQFKVLYAFIQILESPPAFSLEASHHVRSLMTLRPPCYKGRSCLGSRREHRGPAGWLNNVFLNFQRGPAASGVSHPSIWNRTTQLRSVNLATTK
jgi:hypothetical protein